MMYLFDVHVRDENWNKIVFHIECVDSEKKAIEIATQRAMKAGYDPDKCTLIGVQWLGYVNEMWKNKKFRRGPKPMLHPYFKELDRDEKPGIQEMPSVVIL